MIDGYFDNTLDTLNLISRRKHIVQDELARLGDYDCKNTPDVPCCLLQTESGLLDRLKDVLDRELYHEKNAPHDNISTAEEAGWIKRLRAEWRELCERMEKLDNFRDRFRQGDIDFVPKWGERLLCDQLRAMRTYRDCLLQYANLEGIELDTTIYDDSYRFDYFFADEKSTSEN